MTDFNPEHPPHIRVVNLLREFSIPLIMGVIVALVVANLWPSFYDKSVHLPLINPAIIHSDESHEGHCASHEAVADCVDKTDASEPDRVLAVETSDQATLDADAPATEVTAAEVVAEPAEEAEAHGKSHGVAHYFTLHFLINELFMVLFFGIAAKEITESCLPGGALNPLKKAVNPLLGTLGGVVGPVGVFFATAFVLGHGEDASFTKGWGIPTATDIALAWLVARLIFGKGHPAINFLLLLAVADDAIGLGIIAVAYGDSANPAQPMWLVLVAGGMAIAYGLKKMKIDHWLPYVLLGGGVSWIGLYMANLHPALALVPIVPFMPHAPVDLGLFEEAADFDKEEAEAMQHNGHAHSVLARFEHALKLWVDFGLFFFAYANAGVAFSSMGDATWTVLAALLIGKTIGITLFSGIGNLIGFPLPSGMNMRHLVVAGMIAGLGLTVALFVCGAAYPSDAILQGSAKMGALFSGLIFIPAFILGSILKVKKLAPPRGDEEKPGLEIEEIN